MSMKFNIGTSTSILRLIKVYKDLFPFITENNNYYPSYFSPSQIATIKVKIVEKNPVLPGWTQYSKSNKNTAFFDVTYGDKTKRQIEQELEEMISFKNSIIKESAHSAYKRVEQNIKEIETELSNLKTQLNNKQVINDYINENYENPQIFIE